MTPERNTGAGFTLELQEMPGTPGPTGARTVHVKDLPIALSGG